MCEHNPTKITIEDGQNVCMQCGTILQQFITQEAEWRYYGSEDRNDDPSRVGLTIHSLLPESSYGSMAMNKKTNSAQFKTIQRLSSWSLASNSERSWLTAMEIMNGYAYRHGFTKAILQEACALFHGTEDALKLRGETRRALMGACLFLACRRFEVSRTHEEISNIVKVSTRSLSKAIQKFGILQEENTLLNTQLSLAERMMNGLSIDEKQREKILEAIRNVFKNPDEELEHTPKVMVAGIIASILTSHMEKTARKTFLKDFSKHSGVSTLSIQKVVSGVYSVI